MNDDTVVFWENIKKEMISGGAGWKFDIGKPNGFVLDVGPAFDYFAVFGDFAEGIPVNFRAKVQIGYAW